MNRQVPPDMESHPYDLIVVGAGLNGAGIAREAATRGLEVLLLDKSDIASGTTSWSGRLIHGGLRYLEYGEISLVRESLKDREILLRAAPHLVKPLGFVAPIYEGAKYGPLTMRAGMLGYDVFSPDKSMPSHEMLSRKEALERFPGLNPKELKGAAFYYDAQAEYAERLAVEVAVSAREQGATVLSYCEVTSLIREGNDVAGVRFTDRIDGTEHAAYAPVTVNVAGPWVDRVLAGAGDGSSRPGRMVGGTKGSHIIVDPFPGAPEGATIYTEARADGRPYFINPWNGRYLIGTTDFRYEGDLDHVEAEEWEIEYLIDETNAVIPQANLSREDVLFTYSGVRPLPYKPEGSEGSVTRSHIIHDHTRGGRDGTGAPLGGLISIVGGKLTTYRNLSRQTVNAAGRKLGRRLPRSRTHKMPLPGGDTRDFESFAAGFKAGSGLPPWLVERLLDLYGVRAPEVVALAGEDESLLEPLNTGAPPEATLTGAEVIHAFQCEMAEKLSDVLLRRAMVGMGPKVGLDADEAAARVAAEHLGWSEERARREVEEYREFVRRFTPGEVLTS